MSEESPRVTPPPEGSGLAPEPARPDLIRSGHSGQAPEFSSPCLLVELPSRLRAMLEGLRALSRHPLMPRKAQPAPFQEMGGEVPFRAMLASALYHTATVLFVMNPLWLHLAGSHFPEEKKQPAWEIKWVDFSYPLPEISSPQNAEEPASEAADTESPAGPTTVQDLDQTLISAIPLPTAPEQTLLQPGQTFPPAAESLNLPNVVLWQTPLPAPPPEPLPEPPELTLDLPPLELTPIEAPAPYQPEDPADLKTLNSAAELEIPEPPHLQLDPKLPVVAPLEMDLTPYKPEIDPEDLERILAAGLEEIPDRPPSLQTPLDLASLDTGIALLALSATPPPPERIVNKIPPGSQQASFAAAPTESGTLVHGTPGPGNDAMGHQAANDSKIKIPGITVKNHQPSVASAALIGGPGIRLGERPRRSRSRKRTETLRQAFAAAQSLSLPGSVSSAPRESTRPDLLIEAPFQHRKTYTMYINMPNLTSASGSWILEFAVLGSEEEFPAESFSDEVESPQPLRKVDPRYDVTAKREGIEGIVTLYAVITRQGQVEQARVLRSLDERLDRSAVEAIEQWQFQPASRNGEPVGVEIVVEIPFRRR